MERKDPAIIEFNDRDGYLVEDIAGQTRFGYTISDNEYFYEIPEIIENNGFYKGAVIKIFDFESRKVYQPFEKNKNVSYGGAVYLNRSLYFLQGDFNLGLMTIYQYNPGHELNKIQEFKIDDLDLYNLVLMGQSLHLVSSDEQLNIYYPYRKTIDLENNESALFIKNDQVYISAWIEEDWDDENNMAGPDYDYYDKLVVKDMEGRKILEKRGTLFQHTDGSWRLA